MNPVPSKAVCVPQDALKHYSVEGGAHIVSDVKVKPRGSFLDSVLTTLYWFSSQIIEGYATLSRCSYQSDPAQVVRRKNIGLIRSGKLGSWYWFFNFFFSFQYIYFLFVLPFQFVQFLISFFGIIELIKNSNSTEVPVELIIVLN